MAELRLAYPKRIDVAVPANLACGAGGPPDATERPSEQRPVAVVVEQLGRQDADVWSGLGI
jgi:hypothetical protein